MKSFKDLISKPTDYDTAHFLLGESIGLWEKEVYLSSFKENKGKFLSEHPIGNMLHDIMVSIVEMGFIIFDDEDMTYCWNGGL